MPKEIEGTGKAFYAPWKTLDWSNIEATPIIASGANPTSSDYKITFKFQIEDNGYTQLEARDRYIRGW